MTLRSNDLCHCGSGKKYKHCCLKSDYSQEPAEHADTARILLDWLNRNHRKTWHVAIESLLKELLTQDELEVLSELDAETNTAILINLSEWLLAEGSILVKGEKRRVPEYLLGTSGPRMTAVQRNWLMQLENNPLRLYDVTDVIPGAQMTLCDVLSPHEMPIVVRERTGTQSLKTGECLGCRIMRVDTHYELSGAAYPFSMLASQSVGERLQAIAEEFKHERRQAQSLGIDIMSMWLQQWVTPPPIPMMMDAYSGEPLQLVTDHYLVKDWQALEQALRKCADVHGSREDGWDQVLECADGQLRPMVTINVGKLPNQVELFTKTLAFAATGRAWFEEVVGDCVQYLHRQSADPRDIMINGGGEPFAGHGADINIDSEALDELMEKTIGQLYANWANEPIGMLGNLTPRQAMQTPAGLERVKGLIRSYESGEEEQAALAHRAPVSYAFLWESIGLTD